MKKITLFSLLVLFSGVVLVGCAGKQSKLDELLAKKNKLRAELAEVQAEINKLGTNEETSSMPLVALGKLERKRFQHKIIVQGNVETNQDAIINSELGGIISSIRVKEGDRVEKGQVLVSIDASLIAASVDELKTQLEYATYLLGKQTELKSRGVGTEFDYKAAQNQVNSLKAKLNSIELQRSKANITAPFSGIVDEIFAKEGQMASPQAQILRIVNTDDMTITADLSEKHFKNIRVGTEIHVRFPNFRDTVVPVKISSVSKYIDPTNRTFRISAKVSNNKMLVPNMLAELEITDLDVKEALVIPTQGILKDYSNNDYIFMASKKEDNTYALKKVFIDEVEKFNGESLIDLKDPLAVGSKIVVDGVKGITESDVVRIK